VHPGTQLRGLRWPAIESVIAPDNARLGAADPGQCLLRRDCGIARSYADHRIRIVENATNVGLEANWNRALEESRGNYAKLLPADDYLMPRCLETQVAALAMEANRTAGPRLLRQEDRQPDWRRAAHSGGSAAGMS